MSTKKYVYYVFRATNYAETWRDADDIQRTDIGMYGSLKKAKKAAYDDINYVASFTKFNNNTTIKGEISARGSKSLSSGITAIILYIKKNQLKAVLN